MMQRKRIYKLLSSLLIVTFLLAGCTGNKSKEVSPNNKPLEVMSFKETNKGIEKVAENEFLELSINNDTTEIYVKDKKTGKLWTSNPRNANMDSIANPENKARLQSQIMLTYDTPKGQSSVVNNYSSSILDKQYRIEKVKNGVKVTYTIGKVNKVYIIPQVISEKRFKEKILNNIKDSKSRDDLERKYQFLSLEKMSDEDTKKENLKKYPSLESTNIYVFRSTANVAILEECAKTVESSGYTIEDMEKDHEDNKVDTEGANKELFNIPVIYSLEKDSITATIPGSEINYNKEFPLVKMRLLEFFGAAGSKDEGYMFVPDGSGSLIYLNNGKSYATPFLAQVYGSDNSIKTEEKFSEIQNAYLPVFGMKQGDGGFIGIIEEGEAFANILADVSGRLNSYNNVCVEFNTIPNDVLHLGKISGNKLIKVYQPRIYEGDFKIRYYFMDGKDSSYSSMANRYRQYLIEQGKLKKKEKSEGMSFALEVIGAIDKVKRVLGIPKPVIEPITTFDETVEIVEKLIISDVKNIKLKYTGWNEGGVYNKTFTNTDIENKLGSEENFNSMTKYLKNNKVDLFLDTEVQYLYKNKLLDDFYTKRDASRYITKDIAENQPYNIANFVRDKRFTTRYIANPNYISKNMDKFVRGISSYDVKGIALRSIGEHLNSDFKQKEIKDRQQSEKVLEEAMKKLKTSGNSIINNGGNGYTLAYSDYLLNMPMESNYYTITDESIPFYQMVVHGFIEYAGEPLNLTSNYRKSVLKTLETGAMPYYQWMYKNNSLVKDTEFSYLYSCQYSNWIEDAVKTYRELSPVLGDVQNKAIIEHKRLSEGVYQVQYENGKLITVNYNEFPVTIGNTIIAAEGYAIQGGK
jgi:hypothetical protein